MQKIRPRPADDARLAAWIAAALLVVAIAQWFGSPEPAPSHAFARHLVDLNAAPPGEVEALPGVGPVLASRIVAARAASPFRTADDLARVPGVGPSTIERLRAFVTCEAP